jgi:hypothetical protein
MKPNLPPSYLLIHRVWLGSIVLAQLNVRAAFADAGGVLPGPPSTRRRTA